MNIFEGIEVPDRSQSSHSLTRGYVTNRSTQTTNYESVKEIHQTTGHVNRASGNTCLDRMLCNSIKAR